MQRIVVWMQERPAAVSGLLLVLATLAALAWANSPGAASYAALWQAPLQMSVGAWGLRKPLILWINDLLMAVFFLLVGLEIKRELFEGALSSWRKAALPLAAAVGGIVVPAGLYRAWNGLPGGVPEGWAVPAATDIAFALGVLALLGPRVPLGLKVFLTTVAVVDDLMAIFIIAVFLTKGLSLTALLVAGLLFAVLLLCGRLGLRHTAVYFVLGAALWVAVLKSGLHATLAGVLLAVSLPMRRGMEQADFVSALHQAMPARERESRHALLPDSLADQVAALARRYSSPVLRWEHAVQPWVLFVIVPVFALANAGVSIHTGDAASPLSPPGMGVLLGLLLGKPLGITLFAALALRLRWAEIPLGLNFSQLHAVSWLAGIGFTMSLFVAGLSLTGPALQAARLALLVASGVAAAVGAALVWRTTRVPGP